MKFEVIKNNVDILIPTFKTIPVGTCFRWAKNGPHLNLKVGDESFVELMYREKAGDFKVTTATYGNCSWITSNVYTVDATLVIKE